jgi:hypothetical protein
LANTDAYRFDMEVNCNRGVAVIMLIIYF